MHGLQVVHGNLKGVRRTSLAPNQSHTIVLTPHFLKANIYIRNFRACIADFGISTIAKIEPWIGTNRASIISLVSFTSGGSLRWMSPELLDPKKFNTPDPRPTKESDRFALGMLIYEVCVVTARIPLPLSRRSYGMIGTVRTRTIRWLGSREDQ